MNNWVNLNALWRIVGIGLLAGAGLPAIFALGVRALASGSHPAAEGIDGIDGIDGIENEQAFSASRTGIALAGFCFAVVLAAIGYGIYLIVKSG